jgi:hypothetical protein
MGARSHAQSAKSRSVHRIRGKSHYVSAAEVCLPSMGPAHKNCYTELSLRRTTTLESCLKNLESQFSASAGWVPSTHCTFMN